MPKKLNKGFVGRKSVLSKAEDYGKEDASKSPMEAPVAMETYSSELEVPSTSENTSEKAISLLEPENLIKINKEVSVLLNDRFQNKTEIVVNRRVLEELVSETLGHFYSQKDKLKDISEVKNLKEKCKTLESQQIELNKKRYALEKQIEDAKCTIKDLIEEKCLFNRGTVRRILPGTKKRQCRSVGLQVCLVGPLLMRKPVTYYSVTGQYSKLLSEEPSTASKHNVHIEADVMKENEPCTSKVTENEPCTSKVTENEPCTSKVTENEPCTSKVTDSNSALKKETPTGRKPNITSKKMPTRKTKKIVKDLKKLSPVKEMSIEKIEEDFEKLVIQEKKVYEPPSMKRYNTRSRKMSKECADCRETPQEETPSGSSLNSRRMSTRKTQVKEVKYFKSEPEIFQEPTISGASINETSSGSKSKIKSRRMPTKKVKVGNNKPLSAGKVESIKELDEGSKQIVNEQTCDDIIVISDDEEIEKLDDLIVLSSDDDMVEETKYEVNESQGKSKIEEKKVMDYDKKETGIQVNMDIYDNSILKSNESSSSQGTRQLIRVRTPEEINEPFMKFQCSSCTTDGENRQLNKLPQYPASPQYFSDSCKPPAPVLVVDKNSKKQGIVLKWSFACETPKNIMEYQLFCYQEKNDGNISNFAWEKVGDIKAMPVPMLCYLSYDTTNITYHFILRAIDNQKLVGDFSTPASFKL